MYGENDTHGIGKTATERAGRVQVVQCCAGPGSIFRDRPIPLQRRAIHGYLNDQSATDNKERNHYMVKPNANHKH
jgi:hypothetical protein